MKKHLMTLFPILALAFMIISVSICASSDKISTLSGLNTAALNDHFTTSCRPIDDFEDDEDEDTTQKASVS